MRWALAIALLFSAPVARAQVFQIAAGDSTLFNAAGGSLKSYFPNSTDTLSAGLVDGRFAYGAESETMIHGVLLSAGAFNLPFILPTDLTATYAFPAFGVSAKRKTDKSTLLVFVGATSQTFAVPFFQSARPDVGTGALFYSHSLTDRLTFTSAEILSAKRTGNTAIESLEFRTSKNTRAAISAGVGANRLFAAALLDYRSGWIQADGSYTFAAPDFRRVISPLLLQENRGLNGKLAFTHRHVRLEADRQSFAVSSQTLAVNSATVSTGISILNASAGVMESSFEGRTQSGDTLGVTARLWNITASSQYFRAATGSTLTHSLAERLSRHLLLSEYLTQSGGHVSASAGGSFSSNRFSVSVQQQTLFIPLFVGRSPFQQTTSLSLLIHLPHALSLDTGTVVDPEGRTRFTISGEEYAYGAASLASIPNRGSVKGQCLSGVVTDPNGVPFEGATIKLGRETVYSDSLGRFELRVRKANKAYPLAVLPHDFATAGDFEIVSAPASCSVGTQCVVVVRRKN